MSAIGGAVSASFYVAADAWVRATVIAKADASVAEGKAAAPAKGVKGAPAPPAKPTKGGKKGKRTLDARAGTDLEYTPPYGSLRREYALIQRASSIGFSGCAWIDVGLHLRGGAQGNIFSWSA